MNRLFRTALMAAVCVGLLSAPAFAAYKKEYKLSVVPAATSGWGLSATYFADLVKERTNGRINIKVYPGAQLMAGKQTSELLLVRRGAIDFALASTINWSPQVQELNLTALPSSWPTIPTATRPWTPLKPASPARCSSPPWKRPA